MRLIDADAAINILEERIVANRSNVALVSEFSRSINYLKLLPAVDAVDRKKLVETIRHCAQYPDGMARLLREYEEDSNG